MNTLKNTILKWIAAITLFTLTAFLTWSALTKEVKAENTAPTIKVVEKIVEVEKELSAPVLDRICKAESKGNQFCTAELVKAKMFKDCYEGRIGMPLMNVNTDGTVDWGYCQINDYHWGDEARKLGHDLMTLEGNVAMAEWIFLNHGTDAWNASKKGWK